MKTKTGYLCIYVWMATGVNSQQCHVILCTGSNTPMKSEKLVWEIAAGRRITIIPSANKNVTLLTYRKIVKPKGRLSLSLSSPTFKKTMNQHGKMVPQRSKHIDLCYHVIRYHKEKGTILIYSNMISHCPMSQMITDMPTKCIVRLVFKKLR